MSPIHYTNGEDDLYILECKYKRGYWVATFHKGGYTYIADGITYEAEDTFFATGYEFDTLKEAKKHCESFGFKMVA